MNPNQGTELRSGRVINSSTETSSPADPDMAQANSNDSDTNDNSDISSQLSEIKESYERRINELHQELKIPQRITFLVLRLDLKTVYI